MVITQDGQLFYVSENVREFLGYSQVGMMYNVGSLPFASFIFYFSLHYHHTAVVNRFHRTV